MRISDWSSDVCSSDLIGNIAYQQCDRRAERSRGRIPGRGVGDPVAGDAIAQARCQRNLSGCLLQSLSGWTSYIRAARKRGGPSGPVRSEEHTSELQSLMRISYAVFCLKKKKKKQTKKGSK